MPAGKFTIRVYGLLMSDKDEILVCDEIFRGTKMTKFPGGGMEQGEGSIECLKREIMEEIGVDAEVGGHFYTTDFYQQSFFNSDFQVICIYYFITTETYSIEIKKNRFEFPSEADGTIVFRWVPLVKIKEEPFTFENDRKVAHMLSEKLSNRG